MDSGILLELTRETMLLALKISLAPMLIALVVGVTIGLIQALTQIQEMTLSFVPKMVIMLLSLAFLFPFMISSLSEFTKTLADHIATISKVDQ